MKELPIISDAEYLVSDVSITHTTPNFSTVSNNFIHNSVSRGLHRLKVNFTIHLVNEADIRKFEALMLKIRGRLNPFKLSLQDDTDAKGHCNPLAFNARPMCVSDVSVGQNNITLNNFSGVIPAGTKFSLPNDSKVYTILDDVKSGKTVEVFPAIRIAHPAKTPLNLKPVLTLRLEADEFTIKYEQASSITLTAVEDL